MDAEKILKKRAALNRINYQKRIAESIEEQQESSYPSNYQSFESSSGAGIVQDSQGNTRFLYAQTNGAVGLGDQVLARNRRFDEMPTPAQSVTQQPATTESTNLSLVYKIQNTVDGIIPCACGNFSLVNGQCLQQCNNFQGYPTQALCESNSTIITSFDIGGGWHYLSTISNLNLNSWSFDYSDRESVSIFDEIIVNSNTESFTFTQPTAVSISYNVDASFPRTDAFLSAIGINKNPAFDQAGYDDEGVFRLLAGTYDVSGESSVNYNGTLPAGNYIFYVSTYYFGGIYGGEPQVDVPISGAFQVNIDWQNKTNVDLIYLKSNSGTSQEIATIRSDDTYQILLTQFLSRADLYIKQGMTANGYWQNIIQYISSTETTFTYPNLPPVTASNWQSPWINYTEAISGTTCQQQYVNNKISNLIAPNKVASFDLTQAIAGVQLQEVLKTSNALASIRTFFFTATDTTCNQTPSVTKTILTNKLDLPSGTDPTKVTILAASAYYIITTTN